VPGLRASSEAKRPSTLVLEPELLRACREEAEESRDWGLLLLASVKMARDRLLSALPLRAAHTERAETGRGAEPAAVVKEEATEAPPGRGKEKEEQGLGLMM
jgi:hypothetical protein